MPRGQRWCEFVWGCLAIGASFILWLCRLPLDWLARLLQGGLL